MGAADARTRLDTAAVLDRPLGKLAPFERGMVEGGKTCLGIGGQSVDLVAREPGRRRIERDRPPRLPVGRNPDPRLVERDGEKGARDSLARGEEEG